MKISRKDAALLTVRERTMLQSTGPWLVRDLASLIKRLRDLRDKQRQLSQRQVVASSRAAKGKLAAGKRSLEKARVLDRALKHFERDLAMLNLQSSAAAKELKITARAAKKAPAKKTAASSTAKKKAASKKVAAKKATKPAAPKKTAAKKAVVKKAATKKTSAGKKTSVKKTAAKQSAAKAPAKATAKKTAASKASMPPVAVAAIAHTGPERTISAKARIRLPKGGHGDAPSQASSLPSLHRRGLRGR
ncbi:hypothetical protein [Arenimonas alkanexedens]